VISLRALGYDCVGVDFADKTISMLKSVHPSVPFHAGDIRALPFEDEVFEGYISLGVIEHFETGQVDMLKEAARVLKPGGHAFVSVPFYNPYRALRTEMKSWKSEANQPYFECCISLEELKYIIEQAGFDYVDVSYCNPIMTFAQETPIRRAYQLIEDVRYVRSAIDRSLKAFLPTRYFSHIIMIVGRKR
jgi:ubiquinone/menaquinone biosynthesis C-methylase UbiE